MEQVLNPDQAGPVLHELAEALQSLGNYLGALRRGTRKDGGLPPDSEIMERAISQWGRAGHATRELLAQLEEHLQPNP